MSNTPRTDNCIDIANDEGIEDVKFCEVIANLARQLERELAEARAEIDALRMGKRSPCDYYFSRESEENLYRDLAEVRADLRLAKNIIETHVERVAERDKLIEQMREALIVADSLVTSLIDTHVDRCASAYDFDRNIIKAALSAAERIKP